MHRKLKLKNNQKQEGTIFCSGAWRLPDPSSSLQWSGLTLSLSLIVKGLTSWSPSAVTIFYILYRIIKLILGKIEELAPFRTDPRPTWLFLSSGKKTFDILGAFLLFFLLPWNPFPQESQARSCVEPTDLSWQNCSPGSLHYMLNYKTFINTAGILNPL